MNKRHIVIAGGGAAGIFAAIACAEAARGLKVTVLEKSPQPLAKVRISGGGRCNVTHACFDPRELSGYYPRGAAALRGPLTVFQPRDTIAWFERRGVKLKTEPDGRIFPVTDTSSTIIDCLLNAAQNAGVGLVVNNTVEKVARNENAFLLTLNTKENLACGRLMLATGGCRAANAGAIAVSLGHTLVPPVPSLFTFHVPAPWLRQLAGTTLETAEISVPAFNLCERGGLLITHEGLSGPAVLRTSAWGARSLNEANYKFTLKVNWLPHLDRETISAQLETKAKTQPAKFVVNTPLSPLSARLWEALVLHAAVPRETRWSSLSRSARHNLIERLIGTELPVSGKSLNQEEFVTCGGVPLREVNFKTMESRLCPGLYFGGELLDIDGVTGGFNFQAAWTTGWIAGRAMAGEIKSV
jgi:predicted Rossmann fold flavoprotein